MQERQADCADIAPPEKALLLGGKHKGIVDQVNNRPSTMSTASTPSATNPHSILIVAASDAERT